MHLTMTYKSDSILSLPPEQVLLRLYEGLIVRLEQAQTLFEGGDRARAGTAITRSLAIVNALREALDRSVETPAVPMLDQLYGVVSQWLLEANLKQSKDRIQNSLKVLRTLKEGWDGAVQQIR
jgi:flagellar protein FliS